MRLAHFYHCYAGADLWREPVEEHLEALEESGFDGALYIGLVGSQGQCRDALAFIRERRSCEVAAEARSGFEQVTLDAVLRYAKRHGGAVMYAHSKGAGGHFPRFAGLPAGTQLMTISAPSDGGPLIHDDGTGGALHPVWRAELTDLVIRNWQGCLETLRDGRYDVVGADWVEQGKCFIGNFWMARCSYLRRLPKCSRSNRLVAENWVALADPDLTSVRASGRPLWRETLRMFDATAELLHVAELRELLGPSTSS